jgi:hypothetical protein
MQSSSASPRRGSAAVSRASPEVNRAEFEALVRVRNCANDGQRLDVSGDLEVENAREEFLQALDEELGFLWP